MGGVGAKAVRLRDVPAELQDLSGKVIVFSGGSDGMGRVALSKLSNMGATLLLLGRDPEKCRRAIAEIGGRIFFVKCDFASLASVRAAAEEVLRATEKIDVLVNCAGANFHERKLTEDGFEGSWGVNHLAVLLLTMLLLERLKESAPARIVQLSSATEKFGHIDLNDLQTEKRWSLFKSYSASKLAMNMCARRLARDLEGTGVTVNALNPGFIKTNLLRDLDGCSFNGCIGRPMMAMCAEATEVGAERIITASIAKQYEGVSGKFIYEDCVREPNKEALDEALVEEVWKVSKRQVQLA